MRTKIQRQRTKNILLHLAFSMLLFFQPGYQNNHLFSQVSFSGGWENGITGNGNWIKVQQVASDRFQRVTNPVRQGQYSVRVEVRPGDDPISSSGERAEVVNMTDAGGNPIYENESSGTQYYAFSFRLDPTWKPPAKDVNGRAWALIFQLHGPDALGTSPSITVSIQKGIEIFIHAGNLDSPSGSVQNTFYPLSDSTLNIGKWVDLVLKIKFAKDFTGAVTVWRRNEGQANFLQVLDKTNIPTLQYKVSQGGVGNHYWKHGLYRSKQTGTITNILWLDGMTRGNTYNDVVCTAFGCGTTSIADPVIQDSPVMIYPNPFSSRFTVNINPETNIENMRLNIYDLCGKEVKTVAVTNHETMIDRGELPDGIYFYSIVNNNIKTSYGKLVVQ